MFKFCIVANFPIVHYAKMNTQNLVYLTWKFITKINLQTSLSQKWLKRGPNNKQNGVSRYQSKQIPSERNLSMSPITLMKEIYHDYDSACINISLCVLFYHYIWEGWVTRLRNNSHINRNQFLLFLRLIMIYLFLFSSLSKQGRIQYKMSISVVCFAKMFYDSKKNYNNNK